MVLYSGSWTVKGTWRHSAMNFIMESEMCGRSVCMLMSQVEVCANVFEMRTGAEQNTRH